MKIIDVHTHLGNILYPNGKDLIYQKNGGKLIPKGPTDFAEKILMRHFGIGRFVYQLSYEWVARNQVARGMTATLHNLRQTLDQNQVSCHVCMPIAPYLTFEDLVEAAKEEPRIIPFTSIDFTRKHNIEKKLKNDVLNGARGLKLHSIIQCQPLCGRPTMDALQSFEPLNKPVLVHAGPSSYYPKAEYHKNQPENGNISDVIKLVRTFPNIPFIIGHSGLYWVNEIRKHLADCRNVWLDTSFQSPGSIKKLIRTFGLDKVMYASDWPWGSQATHIKIVKVVCRNDREMAKRIFYQNASKLLGLES